MTAIDKRPETRKRPHKEAKPERLVHFPESMLLSTHPDDEYDWREDARCSQVDPDAFFPETGKPARDAKRICAGCPVREQCLMDALTRDERYGVWGGTTPHERRPLRASLGLANSRSGQADGEDDDGQEDLAV